MYHRRLLDQINFDCAKHHWVKISLSKELFLREKLVVSPFLDRRVIQLVPRLLDIILNGADQIFQRFKILFGPQVAEYRHSERKDV